MRSALRVASAAAAALLTTACVRGCPSSRPPIHLNPSMDEQPKVFPQSESRFFYDGSSMRPPVPGTVAREDAPPDARLDEGKNPDGTFVAAIPVVLTDALKERGRARYAIYCQPCHDARGDGKGILFQRGNIPTASFHQDKIRKYPDGQIFDVITNGSGLMPSYRWPIPAADRWAIVSWVRDLEAKRLAQEAASGAAAQGAPAAASPGAAPAAAPSVGQAAAPAAARPAAVKKVHGRSTHRSG